MSDIDDLINEIDSAMDHSPQKVTKVQGNYSFKDSDNHLKINPANDDVGGFSGNDWSGNSHVIKSPNASAGGKIHDEMHDLLKDVEDVMNDFDADDEHKYKSSSTASRSTGIQGLGTYSSTSSSRTPNEGGNGGKCAQLIISGMKLPAGWTSSAMRPNSCDRMKCNKCDLAVYRHENCIWDKTADYLFFRNNFSNEENLKERMIYDPEYVSYACQCTWISVKEKHLVEKDEDLHWRCAGH
eukprot:CAMPEP_0115005500 /NCGR_PEP_ID=MMETSP0216-20121206/19908_1 /TAXON_ID=223996 /ORGANISM="Protocruzia adherens, Strain Boccale" /LENGTH=239 /DNA_ID=CAMNT_0002371837 /DNA_START=175 /DNA_END=894 /DNA_ORIENTATION=-